MKKDINLVKRNFLTALEVDIDIAKEYEEQNKTLSASSDYNASDENIQTTGKNMQLNINPEDMDY